MKGLCVVLVVLLAGKAENALAGGGELQKEEQKIEVGFEGDTEGSGEFDDPGEKFEVDIDSVSNSVCNEFAELSKAVGANIEVYGDVSATLVDDDRCNNIKRAFLLLPRIETMIERTSPSNLCYVYYDPEDEPSDAEIAEQSDAKIAEHLWGDGFVSGMLRVALKRVDLKLKYGCAKHNGHALCMCAPPKDQLDSLAAEVKQETKALKRKYLMSEIEEDTPLEGMSEIEEDTL